jgi:hypothetical protein
MTLSEDQRPVKRMEYGTSLEKGPLLKVSSPIWTLRRVFPAPMEPSWAL